MHMSNDDFIETDGGVHNIRVFWNRGVNAAMGGLSAQPVFGGPVYFYRNILYHVPTGVALKFSAKPAGLFVWHNTFIVEQTVRDPYANAHFRNNLFLGRDTPRARHHGLGPTRPHSSAPTTTATGPTGVSRRSTTGLPRSPRPRSTNRGRRTGVRSRLWWPCARPRGRSSTALRSTTTSSKKLTPPDPAKRHAVYHSMDLNFGLRAGSAAIDAGGGYSDH